MRATIRAAFLLVVLLTTAGMLQAGEEFGFIESHKAAVDLIAPVSGVVVEVNHALEASPATVNESPYDQGWMARLKPSDPGEMDALMEESAYLEYAKEL